MHYTKDGSDIQRKATRACSSTVHDFSHLVSFLLNFLLASPLPQSIGRALTSAIFILSANCDDAKCTVCISWQSLQYVPAKRFFTQALYRTQRVFSPLSRRVKASSTDTEGYIERLEETQVACDQVACDQAVVSDDLG